MDYSEKIHAIFNMAKIEAVRMFFNIDDVDDQKIINALKHDGEGFGPKSVEKLVSSGCTQIVDDVSVDEIEAEYYRICGIQKRTLSIFGIAENNPFS